MISALVESEFDDGFSWKVHFFNGEIIVMLALFLLIVLMGIELLFWCRIEFCI